MFCEQTEKVSALIDGELKTAEARIVEQHLTGCEECQQARAEFLNLRSEIVGLDAVANPRAATGLLSQILHRRNASRITSSKSHLRFAFRPAFAAFLVIFAAAIVGFLIYQNQPRQIATTPQLDDHGQLESAATPEPPASVPSPTPAGSNTQGEEKPKADKPLRQKPRLPVRVPRIQEPDWNLISPWSNQAIARLSTNDNGDPAVLAAMQTAESQSLTVRHLGQAELLLRSFRNLRVSEPGRRHSVDYERTRAEKLVYQNILLRREADVKGDVQVASLLENLEPILLDIANLPERPREPDVQAIKERLQRKNLVALLQVNSTSLARAND